MNYLKSLFSILLLAMANTAFVSCGDETEWISDFDERNSTTIGGTWECSSTEQAFFTVYDTIRSNGDRITCKSEKTTIIFKRRAKFSQSGVGEQLDNYAYGPYWQIYRTFSWTYDKEAKILYITYKDKDTKDITFYNVGINNSNLTATMYEDATSDKYVFKRVDSFPGDQYNGGSFEVSKRGSNWEKAYEEYLTGQNYDKNI